MKLRIVPYTQHTDPTLPHIVYVHGFMGSVDDWSDVAERLQHIGHHWGIELAGHGQSLMDLEQLHSPLDLKRSPATIQAQTCALVSTLEATFPQPVHLVGYSMGGRIAARAAIQRPDLIASLIVESGDLGLETDREARAALDDHRAGQLLQYGVQRFARTWYKAHLFASLHDRPNLLSNLIERRATQDPQQMAHVIQHASPGRTDTIYRDLYTLHRPKLWIVGALDPKYTAKAHDVETHNQHGRFSLHVHPAAGHNVHAEDPEYFARALAQWIASFSGC